MTKNNEAEWQDLCERLNAELEDAAIEDAIEDEDPPHTWDEVFERQVEKWNNGAA